MSKNKYLIPTLIFFLSFLLNSIGINWGTPSIKRSTLITEKEQIKEALEVLQNVVANDNWQSSHQTHHFDDSTRFLLNIIRTYHPDEQYILKSLASMKPSEFNFDPQFYVYPALLTYITGAAIKICSVLGAITLTPDINFYYVNPNEFAKLFLIGRFICIAFGTGISVLIYLIASKIFIEKKKIFFSVLLTLFSPLNIYWSRFLAPDVPAAFFSFLTLYFCIELIDNKNWKNYLLCAFAAGLALSAKYTSILILLPLFIAHCSNSKKYINKKIIFTYLIMGVIFILINPYLFLSYDKMLFDLEGIKNVKESGWGYSSVLSVPMFVYIFSGLFYNGLGLAYTLVSTLTILISPFLFFRNRTKVLILIYIFIFYLTLSTSKYVAYHYLILYVPLLNIFIVELLFKFSKKIAYSVIILILVNFCAYNFIYYDFLLKKDTRLETGIWIKNNIPKDSVIGHFSESVAFNSPPINIFNYKMLNIRLKKDLIEIQPEYFVISNYIYRQYFRLKDKMTAVDFELLDYLFNNEKYQIIYNQKYPAELFGFKLNKTTDIPDDMIHLNPEFIILKKM